MELKTYALTVTIHKKTFQFITYQTHLYPKKPKTNNIFLVEKKRGSPNYEDRYDCID